MMYSPRKRLPADKQPVLRMLRSDVGASGQCQITPDIGLHRMPSLYQVMDVALSAAKTCLCLCPRFIPAKGNVEHDEPVITTIGARPQKHLANALSEGVVTRHGLCVYLQTRLGPECEIIQLDDGTDPNQFSMDISFANADVWHVRGGWIDGFGNCVVASEITQAAKARRRFCHEEKIASLGALSSGVAHDFNNLLSIIQNGLEVLRPHTQDQDDLFAMLDTTTDRATNLIRDLQDYVPVKQVDMHTASSLAGKRILIIDDESYLGDILTTFSKAQEMIPTAISGLGALKELLQQDDIEFDCVLTDFHMPDGNGTDVMNLLADKVDPKRFIIMSGNVSGIDPDLNEQAFYVLEKPFSCEVLAQVLRDCLN